MINTKKTKFYTVEQVANDLQVHWQTVLDYIKTGRLEAIKLGKGYRIPVEGFNKFIQERKSNITVMAIAQSSEFASKPIQGRNTRYRSLLIVPALEKENIIPNDSGSDNIVREIIRGEMNVLDPKPDVEGLVYEGTSITKDTEIYFRSTSSGVLFVRSSLTEPEEEVHIRGNLSLTYHLINVASQIYEKFGYTDKVFLKFRLDSVKDNILKTGSFYRDLSVIDRASRERIEVDEGPIKLSAANAKDLAIKLAIRINRGFGNNRLTEDTLGKFLQNIIKGHE